MIWCILNSTKRISDRQKFQSDQLQFDQLLELQHILTLNRDKFGTGFGIRDNWASRMTSYFFWGGGRPSKFGTVPKNNEHRHWPLQMHRGRGQSPHASIHYCIDITHTQTQSNISIKTLLPANRYSDRAHTFVIHLFPCYTHCDFLSTFNSITGFSLMIAHYIN